MGMIRLHLLSTVAAAAAGFVVPVSAQQNVFDRMDTDKNGKLSRDELPERIRGNFDRVDTDKDGAVSREEDAAFRRRAVGGRVPVRDDFEFLRNVDYVGDGNPRQMLDLLLPKEKAEDGKKPPLLVFIHGGAWRAGSKEGGVGKLREIARGGDYAGATINYRLTGEAIWPAQIHDCKAAIRFLRANADKYGYDGEKIAVWGTSAGGHLVAMLGASGDVEKLEGDLGGFDKTSSRVQAVIDYFGPTEMLTMGDHDSTMNHISSDSPEGKLIGGDVKKNPAKAREVSPVTYVTKDDPPHLIVHGDKDPLVPLPQSEKLDKLFDEAGVSSTLITVVGGGHGNGFDSKVLGGKIRSFLETVFAGKEIALKDEKIPALK